MAETNDILQQIKKVWTNLGAGQKAAAVGITTVVFAGVMAAAFLGSSPDYKQLITGVSGKDMSSVVSQLEDAGITEYRIVDGGTIHVDARDYEMARNILYKSGTLTSKLDEEESSSFLSGGSGMSREERAHARMLKTEKRLEKKLAGLGYIKHAEVTITARKNRFFKGGDSPAKASVIVSTMGVLSKDQIKTVAHVVASGVEALSADAVTIHDSSGIVLKAAHNGPDTRDQESRLAYKSELEKSKIFKVQNMLDQVYGPHKVLVALDVNLDWTRTNTTEKKYDVEGKIVREKTVQESSKPGGSSSRGGAPGVNAVNNKQRGGASAMFKESTKKEMNDYGFKESTLINLGGTITRMTASVLVDESLSDMKDELMETVAGAIGIDKSRGDTIKVTTAKMVAAEEIDLESEAQAVETRETIMFYVEKGSYVILGLAFVFFAMRTIRKAQQDLRQVLEASLEEEEKEAPVQPLTLEESVLETAAGDTELAGRSLRRWLYEGAEVTSGSEK